MNIFEFMTTNKLLTIFLSVIISITLISITDNFIKAWKIGYEQKNQEKEG